MIIGIGTDIVDIQRIARTYERYGERFLGRCFMDDEINLAKKRRKSGRFISTLAKRFAAREAAMKALPLSSDQTISWQDIQIGSHSSGQPSLGFSPHIEKLLQTACPGHMKPVCHLSLSDEKNYAQAFVVIEAQTR